MSHLFKALATSLGPPFAPDSISGIKFWIKNETIAGLSNGTAITTWADSSGSANDAIGGNSPVKQAVSGVACARFTAASNHYMSVSTSDFASQPNSIVIVMDHNSVDGAVWDSISVGTRQIAQINTNSLTLYAGGFLGIGIIAHTPQIYCVRYNDAFSLGSEGGGLLEGNGGVGTNGWVSGFRLGTDTVFSTWSDMDVFEMVAYNAALTPMDFDALGQYYVNKFTALSLPFTSL